MSDETVAMPTKVDGLEINIVDDGFVVYRASEDKLYFLNHTAGLVLELCNGQNDTAELARRMRLAYSLAEAPIEEISTCLESLRTQGLIH